MSTDLTKPRSRRAILGAALGGAAAITATTLGRPLAVAAADGDNAILGQANASTTVTTFENADADESSLGGVHAGTGTGVIGTSVAGRGVWAVSSDATPSDFPDGSFRSGLYATAGDTATAAINTDETGVYGYCDISFQSSGVWGDSPQGYGVLGTGDWGVYALGGVRGIYAHGGSEGVHGSADSGGRGITGMVGGVTPAGWPQNVAVYARADASTSLVALQTLGKVKFSRSGRTSIGATSTTRKITMAGVSTSSYILATMQTNVSGVYVRAVVPASGYFTICLSKAPGKTVYIGYFVIN